MFKLHDRLAADTLVAGDLPLCRVLLMNDSHYPWLILVPKRPDVKELSDLPEAEQHIMLAEVMAVHKIMEQTFAPDKMNVAALGNMVPQLHLHVVARYKEDAAWPAPIWGKVAATPYAPEVAEELLSGLRRALPLQPVL